MPYKSTGELLRLKRKSKGYTLETVAKSVNVSINYISKLEKGLNKNPSDEVIESLARTLDIDEDSLFTLFDKIPLSTRRVLEKNPVISKIISEIYDDETLSNKEKEEMFKRYVYWRDKVEKETD